MKHFSLHRRFLLTRTRHCGLFVLVAVTALLPTAGGRCGAAVPAQGTMGPTGNEVVGPIIERMQNAQSRLKRGDTSSQTRKVQGQVVDDLQKLIDAARRNASRNQQQNPGSGRSSAQPQDQSQRGQASQAGSQPAAGLPTGSKANSKPPATNGKPPALTVRPLWQAVWGHLPPTVRERVRNADFGETILPAYDDLVRRYFEALLDEPPAEGKRQK
jgi:hypothetical protein